MCGWRRICDDMGGWRASHICGTYGKGDLTNVTQKVAGKSIAVPAHEHAHEVIRHHAKNPHRAQAISRHATGGRPMAIESTACMHAPAPLDISTMQILANELYTTVANYAKITGDPKLVWIVLEASYLPKETETKKRRDSTHGYYLRAEELFTGDTGSAQDLSAAADSYKLACTVPDCLLT